MANEEDHLTQANRNQAVLNHLISDISVYSDWLAIAAFYKAVHIVEAVFYCQETVPHKHCTSHRERGELLKRRYPQIWRNYSHLIKASKVARYLEYEEKGVLTPYATFSTYMPPDVVLNLLLGHYLIQVETRAQSLLHHPNLLSRYVTPMTRNGGVPALTPPIPSDAPIA